jgi:hypothetical protein
MLSFVAYQALKYFSTFSHKRHDILKKFNKQKMCVFIFIFSTPLFRKLSHSRKNWARYDNNEYWSSCKVPLTLILLTWRIRWAPNNASKWQMGFNSVFKGLILSDFNQILIFSTDFRKILKYKIQYISVQWSRVVPRGRTDRHDKANRFSQYY